MTPESFGYHVTPATNWPSIAEKGLIAHVGERSECLQESPAIFLFPTRGDCDTALGQWLGDEFEDIPENGLLILKVDLEGLPVRASAEFEREVHVNIPAERIVAVYQEDWTLRECGGVGMPQEPQDAFSP